MFNPFAQVSVDPVRENIIFVVIIVVIIVVVVVSLTNGTGRQ